MQNVTVIDHSANFINRMEQAKQAALESVGTTCRSHAQNNITAGVPRRSDSWYRVTGALRNSMEFTVKMDEDAVYIGTNLKYAIYNEKGTGEFAEDGKGRKGWWVFVPGSGRDDRVGSAKVYTEAEARRVVAILKSKGIDAHMTKGMPPLHFLKKAVNDHLAEYKKIIHGKLQSGMKGGF